MPEGKKPLPQVGIVVRWSDAGLPDDSIASLVTSLVREALSAGRIKIPAIASAVLEHGAAAVTASDKATGAAVAPVDKVESWYDTAPLLGRPVDTPHETAASLDLPPGCAPALKAAIAKALLASLAAQSDGALTAGRVPGTHSFRLSGVVTLRGTPTLLQVDLLGQGDRPWDDAFLVRDLPLFAVGIHDLSKDGEAGAPVCISTGDADNAMAGLSLEDAANWAKVPFDTGTTAPRGSASREEIYGPLGTVPGSASRISIQTGNGLDSGADLARILSKGCEILARRIDIARASVFEGKSQEKFLLNQLSNSYSKEQAYDPH